MATNVIMPSLGFDMTEGKLTRWLVKLGQQVEKGQAIAEIETEKATVEIEATVPGTIQKIIIPADQTVPVGTVIAVIAEPGEQAPSAPTPATALPTAKPETARSTPEKASQSSAHNGGDGARIKASPLARRMAQEAGVDLEQIHGSGPGGRIMERDVQNALSKNAPSAPTHPTPTPAPAAPTAPAAPGAQVPLNRMRQALARRMSESKTTVPHFYVTIEINMNEALKLREQLNALAQDNEKISVNDLVVAAAARTLDQFPNLNSSYRDGSLERHEQVNVGIAVAVEDGLLTPVVRDANKKGLKTLAADSRALSERARTNKLRANDLGGGTFTVSNLGMFGIDEFVAIINPPEAAILAVGAAVKRHIVDGDDELHVASMLKVTLSVDHRVADGAQAARFLQAFRKLLENPVNLLISE